MGRQKSRAVVGDDLVRLVDRCAELLAQADDCDWPWRAINNIKGAKWHAETGLKCIENDDHEGASRMWAMAERLYQSAGTEMEQPDAELGRGRREQQREFVEGANAARHREAEAQRQRWRDEDDKLHAERPELKPKSARARIIRSRLQVGASEDTIARALPRR